MIAEIKGRLVFSIVASVFVLLMSAFEWSLIDKLTPFLYMPLLGLVWLLFVISGITSLSCFSKFREIGLKVVIPISIVFTSFLIAYFVPFTTLWLKADFALYKEEREEVVKKVNVGELIPNVSHNDSLINLGDKYPLISMGGNEIVVKEYEGLKYVFFYTFRGILDNYSGFIYVPSGGDPREYSDLSESNSTQIISLGENWFYASHH